MSPQPAIAATELGANIRALFKLSHCIAPQPHACIGTSDGLFCERSSLLRGAQLFLAEAMNVHARPLLFGGYYGNGGMHRTYDLALRIRRASSANVS